MEGWAIWGHGAPAETARASWGAGGSGAAEAAAVATFGGHAMLSYGN